MESFAIMWTSPVDWDNQLGLLTIKTRSWEGDLVIFGGLADGDRRNIDLILSLKVPFEIDCECKYYHPVRVGDPYYYYVGPQSKVILVDNPLLDPPPRLAKMYIAAGRPVGFRRIPGKVSGTAATSKRSSVESKPEIEENEKESQPPQSPSQVAVANSSTGSILCSLIQRLRSYLRKLFG